MGGNAKKRRMIAATRNAAKEKRETETKGPSTKVTEEEKVQKKTKEQEKPPEPVKVKQTWTGKSPQDLLLEFLQKNKWERTKWNGPLQKLDANGNPCFVWKLSLLHIKKDEKLFFKTQIMDNIDPTDQSEQTWNKENTAKQNCCLAALHHFFPNQPMANHIAPQYRPLWAYLTEKYKQQQEKLQLNATREEQRQMKKKQKEETEEFHKLTRMTILMTEKTRKLASQVIQQLHNFRSVNKIFEPSGKCVDYVLKKGFTLDHIHQFKKYAEIHPEDSEEDVERKFLETLLLHVPEEELPKEFIPSKGNFELLTTSISTQSPDIPLFEDSNDQAEETSNVTNQNKDLDFSFFKNSQPSDMKEIIEFIVSTFSFTNKQVYDFLNNYMHEFQFNESKEWVFALVKSLYDHYCKLHTPNKKIQKFDQSDADNQETLNEIIDEEKEVLKAIYDEQFIENEIKYKNEIIKYWKVPLNIEEINIHGELIVYFQGKGNKYPEEEPWLDIKVSSLSVENKQIIIQTLIYQYNSQEKEFTIPNHIQQPSSLLIHLKESQMISSILSWLEENTAKILETVNSIENGDEITSTPSETSTTDSFTSLSKELTFKKKEITKKKVKIFRKRKMTEKQIAEENEKLLKIENEKKNTEKGKQMEESRRRLPAHQFKEKIISEYLNSDILVISGETGCGKTTQIPQFILEYLLDNRMIAQSNMICTQPRRLSAIGGREETITVFSSSSLTQLEAVGNMWYKKDSIFAVTLRGVSNRILGKFAVTLTCKTNEKKRPDERAALVPVEGK